MRHHFAQPAREEVPPVPRPDSLGMEALDQLTDDRFNAPSLLNQKERPSSLLTFGRTIGRKQVQPLLNQFLSQGRTPIVAISQRPATCIFQKALGDWQLMHISRDKCNPTITPGQQTRK